MQKKKSKISDKPDISFNERCYEILKKVPKGKVVTYKQIANAMNSKAYRAVGNAMNKNPNPSSKKGKVPCHRVIKSNGSVGGYALGQKNKIKMLREEGVEIINNKINLEKFGFDFNF
jgi:methylated-DNA-[protein]-cysteine S-methyltransferase